MQLWLRRSLVAVALAAVACSSPSAEEQKALGQKLAEEAKKSIQSVDAQAREQKVAPEVVKKVQQQLTVLKEYMGPVNGKLDAVTLNAFEAFQRAQGMKPDGMLTDSALAKLDQAAAQAHPTS
ncbi:MAG TPA: peptidoglycan-binding domain-containing protein [Candidatus Binatia bacterium]|nr:peptidoglycan-binding domain-containing protein [Candidatus Binatia bacterium]